MANEAKQLRTGEQSYQSNALKLQQMQQDSEQSNALRQMNPNSPEYGAQLFRTDPELGMKYRTNQTSADESKIKQATAKQEMLAQAARDISTRPSDANITAHTEDVLLSDLYNPQEKDQVKRRAEMLLSMPFEERQAFLAQQGAAAQKPKAPMSEYQQQYLAQQAEQLQLARDKLAASGGGMTPYQEAVLDIQRRKLGQVEAKVANTAQAKEGVIESGRAGVTTMINDLKGYYDILNKEKAITSTKRPGSVNAGARMGASDVGQLLGSALGTEAQSARDSIAQTRPLLLQAIKNATGMSAKQMDSNTELQLYLSTATDPKKSLEANMQALARLDQLYGLGMNPGLPGATPAGSGVNPPLPPGMLLKRPSGVGENWRMVMDGDGNRAWASPDNKSFVEVK